jgi:predicted transcriptional regulator
MINDFLKQLGFGDKEILVYLAIIEQGKATPATIAKITGINRTTVYALAKELVQKRVIVEDLGGKRGYLVALPPGDLKSIIQKEERDLENRKMLVEQAIKELEASPRSAKYSIPKISFIYEEDIENFLYQQTPVWNDSILKTDGIWWGFQDPSFVEHYQKWIDWYWKEVAPKKMVLRLLTNRSETESEMAKRGYERRLMKFWSGGEKLTGTVWINGDYLVMIVTERRPHYLVQIYDATLAHNMREMFKSLWG